MKDFCSVIIQYSNFQFNLYFLTKKCRSHKRPFSQSSSNSLNSSISVDIICQQPLMNMEDYKLWRLKQIKHKLTLSLVNPQNTHLDTLNWYKIDIEIILLIKWLYSIFSDLILKFRWDLELSLYDSKTA